MGYPSFPFMFVVVGCRECQSAIGRRAKLFALHPNSGIWILLYIRAVSINNYINK